MPWSGPGADTDRAGSALRRLEALLQAVELGAELPRHAVAEVPVVVADAAHLGEPAVHVDAQQLGQVLLGHVEPGHVELAPPRQVADRGLDGLGRSLAALEDPLEHAAVLAVAGPQE